MHIPDGLMDPSVALVGWGEFLAAIAIALFFAGKAVREKDLPRIAVLCAGIFVAQMLNFPVGGGTTGHLIGGMLFALMAGPVIAMVGMTVILLIQALMFGDGGITAFGLNAVNMAVIAPLSGWGVYTLIMKVLQHGTPEPKASGLSKAEGVAVMAGAWASVFLAASACAAELAVSYAVSGGTYGIAGAVSIPAMLGYHAIIGIGEAVITVGVVAYVSMAAPGAFVKHEAPKPAEGWRKVASSKVVQATAAVLVVFALCLPLYFMYSSEGADGLEKTMEDSGVTEGEAVLTSPFSYGEDYFAALFAGMLGFVVVALSAIGLLTVIRSRKVRTEQA